MHRLKDIEQFEEPKDLYTGYIVRMHQFLFDGTEYENEITGVLEYEEELACVCLTKMQQKDIQKHMGYEDDQDGFEGEKVPVCNFHGLHECSWTYLGNIYEHPHLLEAE
ncbi:YopX family protein [Geomicrobium sp. JCM 19037]|uniref:YopX family protein n=1 Tax=Geomicrobium sp. JCM 19037 TaxID=1460634 RepID=UPI0005AAFB69